MQCATQPLNFALFAKLSEFGDTACPTENLEYASCHRTGLTGANLVDSSIVRAEK